MAYLRCLGTLNSAATRSFHLCYLTTWFAPITAVRWPSRGKFVHVLADILFMTYYTSRYMHTAVCACQVWVQRERLIFFSLFVKHIVTWILQWQPQCAQRLQGPDTPLIYCLVLLKARCLSFVSFCPIVVDFLKIIIAFAFKFFFLC